MNLASAVVGVGELFAVGVDQLPQPVVGVVGVLGDVDLRGVAAVALGCRSHGLDGLDRFAQRAVYGQDVTVSWLQRMR